MTDRRDEPSVMSVYDPLLRELGRTQARSPTGFVEQLLRRLDPRHRKCLRIEQPDLHQDGPRIAARGHAQDGLLGK
jgi:hypothetical protein